MTTPSLQATGLHGSTEAASSRGSNTGESHPFQTDPSNLDVNWRTRAVFKVKLPSPAFTETTNSRKARSTRSSTYTPSSAGAIATPLSSVTPMSSASFTPITPLLEEEEEEDASLKKRELKRSAATSSQKRVRSNVLKTQGEASSLLPACESVISQALPQDSLHLQSAIDNAATVSSSSHALGGLVTPGAASSTVQWTPKTREKLVGDLLRVTPQRYQAGWTAARTTVENLNFSIPDRSYLTLLSKFGADWNAIVQMLLKSKPHKVIFKRIEARENKARILEEGPVESHQCLSQLRVKDLDLELSDLQTLGWSPGAGTLSSFAEFIRRINRITDGRNIAIAIAFDENHELIYTLAITDGPPGGDHSELLAWDAMPELVKDIKRCLIYTERAPCTRGSRCRNKLQQKLGENCFILYTIPIVGESRSHNHYATGAQMKQVTIAARSIFHPGALSHPSSASLAAAAASSVSSTSAIDKNDWCPACAGHARDDQSSDEDEEDIVA